MRKLLKFLTSRLVWSALFFILQFVLLGYVVLIAANKAIWYRVFTVGSICLAALVMTREENPAYKMTWVFLMMIFPLFGGLLYLMYGNKKFGYFSRRKVLKYVKENYQQFPEDSAARGDLSLFDPQLARQSDFIRATSHFGVWRNTDAQYFGNGEDFLADLLEMLKKAEHFIFLEYFIIGKGLCWSQILEILKKKAEQGVDVRIIYDDVGSINSVPAFYDLELRKMGINAVKFNPIHLHFNPRLNFRDHRKILIIDGNACYTGGLNLSDEYINEEIRFGYWKDNAIRLSGDAVWNFTIMFLEMWYFVTGEDFLDDVIRFRPTIQGLPDGFVQPFSDTPLDEYNVAESAYMQIINNARSFVWITTPYLILDNEMITALEIAACSGVDVRIITPHYPDKPSVHAVSRSYYPRLLKAGVKIFEFTPGFIHSKTFVADDNMAFVGTANMDYRSFYLHFELSVAFYGSSIVHDVKEDFITCMNLSEEQELDKVLHISPFERLRRAFLRFFAPAL